MRLMTWYWTCIIFDKQKSYRWVGRWTRLDARSIQRDQSSYEVALRFHNILIIIYDVNLKFFEETWTINPNSQKPEQFLKTIQRSVDSEIFFLSHCFDQNSNESIVRISTLKFSYRFLGTSWKLFEASWGLSK